ncbi:hypothetical protein M514_27483 [Trichuris suis]|uniref:Mos1 transposase HTH domain-containing protein n=1 Tax=Trichuris suis TaxID=68888 RepID=A0A085MSY9_9BILA|nr:hypothetical protein M514_27483 [Trichuris suis]
MATASLPTKNKTAAEAKEILNNVYGDTILAASVCPKWHRQFRSRDFSVNDRATSRCPKETEASDTQCLKETSLGQHKKRKKHYVQCIAVGLHLRGTGNTVYTGVEDDA